MKKLLIVAVGLFFAIPSFADTIQVSLFNTDDTLKAAITNSNATGQVVLTNTFLHTTGLVDISASVTPGSNRLDFLLTNTMGGYTWGIQVFDNGSLIFNSSCGTVSIFGCNNNDFTTFTDRNVGSVTFNVSENTVPEPSTLWLLGSGLVFAGVRVRRILPLIKRG
jgi:hypothetical protein